MRLLTVAAAKEKQARGRRDCVGEEEEATVLILDDADVDAADDGSRGSAFRSVLEGACR